MDSLRGYCCKPSQRTGNRLVVKNARDLYACFILILLFCIQKFPARGETCLVTRDRGNSGEKLVRVLNSLQLVCVLLNSLQFILCLPTLSSTLREWQKHKHE
jgi:hypothetical protein